MLCAGATLSVAAHASEPAAQRICLRGNGEDAVIFHGAFNFDKAGSGPGSMLYPVPGLAGLLAAVATHAVIGAGMRDSEKQKVRDEADKVLLPYQEALAGYKYRELMAAALAEMKTAGDKRVGAPAEPAAPGEATIDSAPAFSMTQDQRALILENTISIRAGGVAQPIVKVIRVVSSPRDENTGPQAWFNDKENLLRKMAARMYAQSLDIALADMKAGGDGAPAFRTVRYSEGGFERIERAQVVSEQCGRLVLRNLRGDLMSVPSRVASAADPGCAGT